MRRIALFLLTNLAIMLMLSVVVTFTGANRWLTANGIQYSQLLAFCAIFGFGGSAISLLLSKPLAKWSTRAQVVDGTESADTQWLVSTVADLAHRAGITCPEVAVFEGTPNAFATGAFRHSALVAVSTGLLELMNREQVRAVLAHEVAHVANGDMQTMGLLQGVMNTFVMFLSRVVGMVIDRGVLRNESSRPGVGYIASVFALDLVFGLLASFVVMAFSRHREFRADHGAAVLLGSARPMQSALRTLLTAPTHELPRQVSALGITNRAGLTRLLSSHPALEDRIAALDQFRQ